MIPPHRRDDVLVVDVGADVLLYDPVSSIVHRLNPAALLVWQCCDGTADVSEISADLSDAFAEPSAAMLAEVRSIIDEFSGHGLLVGAPPHSTHRPTAPVVGVDRRRPAVDPTTLRGLGPFAVADARFTIECRDAEAIADELDRVLASLLATTTDRDGSPPSAEHMVVWSDAGDWYLDTPDQQLTSPDESTLVDFVVQQITRRAIESSPRHLVLHASTVACDGQAVMMPARANSGKSTLAAIMVQAGFDYLTDEASFLDLQTGEIVAFPKPIMLDPGSQQMLAHLEPPGMTGQSTKWRIAPESIRAGAVAERAHLAHIVLPAHDAEAENVLVGQSTIDGVIALLAAAVNVADHVDHLDDLVAIVDSCTVHALRHDGIDGPRSAIESLFDAPPVTP